MKAYIIVAAFGGFVVGSLITIMFQSIGSFLSEFREFKEYKMAMNKLNYKENGEDGSGL